MHGPVFALLPFLAHFANPTKMAVCATRIHRRGCIEIFIGNGTKNVDGHKSCECSMRPGVAGVRGVCAGARRLRGVFAQPIHPSGTGICPREEVMLHYAIVFFVIAIIAAIFGFGGIAAGAVGIAKVLFFIFIVLFLVSLITGLVRRS